MYQNPTFQYIFSIHQVVEKLFIVSSNFTSEPTTPSKQWEEFKAISELVERVREIESGHSMCRTLPDRRSAVRPFTAWLTDLGAVIKKVQFPRNWFS